MHEFGMVDDFIHALVNHWSKQDVPAPAVIRIVYGPGLVEESLRQAFEVHAAGTCLENTRFEFEKKPVRLQCVCGAMVPCSGVDLSIPYVVCPDCEQVLSIPGFNVIELAEESSHA